MHIYNRHRGGGGSDNAWDATIRLSRQRGLDIHEFSRDSRDIPSGLAGRLKAACSGIYAHGVVREFSRVLRSVKPGYCRNAVN